MPSDYRPAGLLVPVVTPFGADGASTSGRWSGCAPSCWKRARPGSSRSSTTGEPTSLDAAEQAAVVAAVARVTRRARRRPRRRGRDQRHAHDDRQPRGAGRRPRRLRLAGDRRRTTCARPRPGSSSTSARSPPLAGPGHRLQRALPDRPRPRRRARCWSWRRSPNVAGLKQAVGALDADTLELLAAAPDGFAVLGGDDAFLFPTMLMGGTGAIAASGHLATERFAAMLAAGADGRRRGRAAARRGAAAAGPGAVRRAEPGGDEGAAARAGPDPDAGRPAAACSTRRRPAWSAAAPPCRRRWPARATPPRSEAQRDRAPHEVSAVGARRRNGGTWSAARRGGEATGASSGCRYDACTR